MFLILSQAKMQHIVKINDELILHDVFGSITFKGEEIFIAGTDISLKSL